MSTRDFDRTRALPTTLPRFLVVFSVIGLACVALHAHAQPPQTVLVQGQLLDELGQPLTGTREYRVRFFDAATDGAQLGGDITGQTVLSPDGLFAVPLVPPAAVLTATAAWYELAIDSSGDASGLTGADTFPQRVRVHSVPFARVAGEALSVEVGAIAGGAVTAGEFQSLAGLTGNVQSQLDAKADASEVYTQAEVDAALADKPGADEVLPRVGDAFVVVETTDDPVQNAANLVAAYNQAALLMPHGEVLGPGNHAVVLVPPGRYDFGTGQFLLYMPHVDVEGISRERQRQHIFGTSNGPDTGVIRQTAGHARLENLFVECTRDNGGVSGDAGDPAAYFPTSNLPGIVIRNCQFLADDTNALSMRLGVTYAGTYERCDAGAGAFGGFGGTASGTFVHCNGGVGAFASAGIASGQFRHCTGGTSAFGGGGLASGSFEYCKGTQFSFGGGGTANGTFVHCVALGQAFGGGSTGTASGEFRHCKANELAFGGGGGTASGLFEYCTAGNLSYGAGAGGTALGGEFFFCVGGFASFTNTGSPTVVNCVRDGEAFPP